MSRWKEYDGEESAHFVCDVSGALFLIVGYFLIVLHNVGKRQIEGGLGLVGFGFCKDRVLIVPVQYIASLYSLKSKSMLKIQAHDLWRNSRVAKIPKIESGQSAYFGGYLENDYSLNSVRRLVICYGLFQHENYK